MWTSFALGVKRLHDRDRTGSWLAWQMLVMLVAVVAVSVATALIELQSPAAEYIIASIVAAGVFSIVALVVSIWLLVEIGFLRGTQGPNRFGPDPLGAAKADAQL